MQENGPGLGNLRKQWEKRAAYRKNALSGVLFQGLPEEINRAIHQWHRNILRDKLLTLIPANGRLLDLGCGYGRLSREIIRHRADISVTGADISLNYCRLFKRNINAPAVCAPIEHLPFKPGSFDALLVVTTLMYISSEHQAKVMAGALKLLRPGGHALFFDPGSLFCSLSGKLFPDVRKWSSGGSGITKRKYRQMSCQTGCRIRQCAGGSWLTLALPFAMLLRPCHRLQKAILEGAVSLDTDNARGAPWDVHRWVLIEKPAEANDSSNS